MQPDINIGTLAHCSAQYSLVYQKENLSVYCRGQTAVWKATPCIIYWFLSFVTADLTAEGLVN